MNSLPGACFFGRVKLTDALSARDLERENGSDRRSCTNHRDLTETSIVEFYFTLSLRKSQWSVGWKSPYVTPGEPPLRTVAMTSD